MSIITVYSSNPNFSYIIQKNPATILDSGKPFNRSLRLGQIYGWFTNKKNNEFRILFKDSDAETSFGNRQEFEYLDLTRYSNPYIPILAINEVLSSASKKGHELDVEGYTCTVSVIIQTPLRILESFKKIASIQLDYMQLASNHFFVFLTSDTVEKTLNLTVLMCVLASLADEDTYVPLPEAGVTKYLNVLNRAKAPYFLRYLFLSRAIHTRSTFEKLKPLIDTENIRFAFGNTQVQRLDVVKQVLPTSRSTKLIDIGCGELYNSLRFIDKYETILAFDADEEVQEGNKRRIVKKQIPNITLFNEEVDEAWVKNNVETFEDSDVLLAEVLEHRPADQSIALLKALLNTEANTVVVTVPCENFNQFYGIERGQFRHSDHKWEPTLAEFLNINSKLQTEFINWKINILPVGDKVVASDGNSYSVSLMAVYTRLQPVNNSEVK